MNEQDSLDIQALVDGELDARSAERLRQRLDSEPESVALVRELTALDELLASAPEPSVPPDLERRILQRAPLPVNRRADTAIISRLPVRSRRPQWQGFAMAASLFVAVVIGVGALFPDEMNPDLADQMTGTLLPQAERVGSAQLSWEDVEANLDLLQTDDGISLQIRADAEQPVLLRVRAPGESKSLAELSVTGEQRLVYPLASLMEAIEVDVVREGRVVHSRSLELSGD